MTYEVIILVHLHMPLYFIGTFTEYPYLFPNGRLMLIPQVLFVFENFIFSSGKQHLMHIPFPPNLYLAFYGKKDKKSHTHFDFLYSCIFNTQYFKC